MTLVPILLLSALASAGQTASGPQIDKESCSEAQAKQIRESWPEARKRVAAARANVEKAYAGEDPHERAKLLKYSSTFLGVRPQELPEVARILGEMNGIIEKSYYMCGGVSDDFCSNRGGYIARGEQRDGLDVVHLCPLSFGDDKESGEQRTRTITHESAHLVDPKIGRPDGEEYCIVFDCATPCPGSATGYLVADNWAHFTHCASNQKPDKGDEIVVPRPKVKKGK